MYGFMFTAHTPLFSVYLAKPKILTYQRFDSKDLYIFVIAISQLSTNSMQPSMQGLWISSKTNTDNQSVKIKRFVPLRRRLFFVCVSPYICTKFAHIQVKCVFFAIFLVKRMNILRGVDKKKTPDIRLNIKCLTVSG